MPRWSEHQLAMLREMGIHHFWPQDPSAPGSLPANRTTPPDANANADADANTDADANAAVDANADAARRAPPARAEPLTPAPVPPEPARAPSVVNRHRPAGAPSAAGGAPVAPGAAPSALTPFPEGVAQMDWPALREAVVQCRACALCEGRRQTVFGEGQTSARWMLVAEAPTEQEEQEGETFVGRSGQLLDRMLDAAGLTRQGDAADASVYIAHAVKCRPPGNRPPTAEEVAQCEPYLRRQVALVRPQVVVAMGRVAVQSLLQTSAPLGPLRGRVHDFHGVPVVVTFHPTYLLRNPADKALAWDDLCLAREQAQRGQLLSM